MDRVEILATVLDAVDSRRDTDDAFDSLGPVLDAEDGAVTAAYLLLAAARVLFELATTDFAELRAGQQEMVLAAMRSACVRGMEEAGL